MLIIPIYLERKYSVLEQLICLARGILVNSGSLVTVWGSR